MSNNLRQIAKDLRSFVKRCKDVHYSDSLLITFLVTGLLTTFAPSIIRADVAEDQQEVSAQAYDTITDLRQSFLRAKKENQKALRGANAELAQLLKEGDQVVKSPWASFQFGTGYTNNDWGTSYKGRGGKKLEYYSRTNDLTKYVFDASKHQYGATNLNLPRNQEPNSLAITPANIHEPYKPYAPEKLERINMPTDVAFNIDETNFVAGKVDLTAPTIAVPTLPSSRANYKNEHVTKEVGSAPNANNLYTTYNTNDLTAVTNASNGPATFTGTNGTIEANAGKIYNTRWWWANSGVWTNTGAMNTVSDGTFDIGTAHSGGSYYHTYWTSPTVYSTYNNVSISGATWSPTVSGSDDAAALTGSSVPLTNSSTASEVREWLALKLLKNSPNPTQDWPTIWNTVSSYSVSSYSELDSSSVLQHVGWTINGTTYFFSSATGRTIDPDQGGSYTGWSAHTPNVSVKADKSSMVVKNNTFTITDKAGSARAGVLVDASDIIMTDNNFTINGTGNVGVVVTANGKDLTINRATTGRNTFNVNGTSGNTGILNSGTIKKLSDATFSITATDSNGIRNNGTGEVTVSDSNFTVSGTKSNAINNQSGTKSKTENTQFDINATQSNGITNAGDVKSKLDIFNLDRVDTNGIVMTNSSAAVLAEASTFNIKKNKSNGINGQDGATITVNNNGNTSRDDRFILATGVSESNGIYTKKPVLDVKDVNFVINGSTTNNDRNNGIFIDTGATGTHAIDNSGFSVAGTQSNGVLLKVGTLNVTGNGGTSLFTVNGSNNNGIYTEGAANLSTDNTNFALGGSSNNGVYGNTTGTLTLGRGRTTNTGSWNNGLIVMKNGTVKVQNHNFNIGGSFSNGVYVTKGKTLAEISGSGFTVDNNNVGLLVGETTGASNKAKVTTIENTTFNVNNTNASKDGTGTGIYIYNGEVNVGAGVTVHGANDSYVPPATPPANNGGDILITINTPEANKLTFAGTVANPTKLTGTGDDHVAINLQNGHTANATGTTKTEITGNVDIKFGTTTTKSNNSRAYRVNRFIKELELHDGDGGSAAALGTDNLATTAQGGKGTIFMHGKNNAVYDGLAYVQTGKISLSDVQMVGDNNTIINLQGPTKAVDLHATEAPVGAFGGQIRIQGAMGGEANQYGNRYSKNNIAVYAGSGQNKALGEGVISPLGGKLTNVTIKDINVGFGDASYRGVLIYATNGTAVDAETSTKYEGKAGTAMSTAAITDGVVGAGTSPKRGYNVQNVPYDRTSEETIMGYANGVFSDISLYALSAGSAPKEQSTISFTTDVDMVAKRGIAYYGKNGGVVKTTKATRAGGGESVVAFADGRDVTGLYPGPGMVGASRIETKNITAADYVLLADYANRDQATEISKTYQNIGALALNGGKVIVDGADAEAKSAEQNANLSDGGTETKQSTTSLVYGLGAVASGDGSLVDIKEANAGKGIHVVTGTNGGVYATDKGQVNFVGYITNQNNITTDTTGDILSSDYSNKANGYVTSTTQKRKGIIGTGNDHTNTTPFYVKRTGTDNLANINFTGKTHIGMYDGILYTGNQYGNTIWGNNNNIPLSDYHKKTADSSAEFNAAKYRGMENVTTHISGNKTQNSGVTIGLINQAKDEITWDTNQAGGDGTAGYLKGIGKDYTGMTITNKLHGSVTTEYGKDGKQWKIYSKLINSRLKVTQDVIVENVKATDNQSATVKAVAGSNKYNDPFNNIAMESDIITIDGAKVTGNAAYRDLGDSYAPNSQRKNVGIAMGNSLNRWDDLTLSANTAGNWRKAKNSESGITNSGTVDIWGGKSDDPVIGLLANFGTLKNGDGTSAKKGVIRVDHGYALAATDGSVIQNLDGSEITVTGKYDPAHKGSNVTRPVEGSSSGENYGIVGISDTNAINYNTANASGIGNEINTLEIVHKDAKVYVEGEQSVGIYGENRNNADSSKVTINYTNTTAGGTGIDVSNPNMSTARGIGIALVNGSSTTYRNGWANAGGVITLKGATNGALGTSAFPPTNSTTTLGSLTLGMGLNDILTGKKGVGIYAESAEIKVDSPKFTILTKDDGVGIWAMDDTIIARGANHDKTLNYNYNGAKDKNGFAMAFGGKNTHSGFTQAENYMDIKFSNVGDAAKVNLKDENDSARTGTNKGIVGLLVNTNDAADKVTNYGKIEEDTSSKTNLKAYGALVNKGTFINHGDITLNASLMNDKNSTITSADMKKVNVGILANDHSERARDNSYIENYANITIGQDADSKHNVGSWAIYGYNIKTGAKLDGTEVVYKINRNSNGIYSGDGNVDIQRGTVLKVGNDTVLGHKQVQNAVDSAGNLYTISNRQTAYADPDDLLSGLDNPRERDSAVGVYINNNRGLSDQARTINVAADMDIDRFSHGIVLAEKTGGAETTVNLGTSAADAPKIKLAYSTANNAGGHVKSVTPHTPEIWDKEPEEQGNSVYYYSADTNSKATSYANVTMDGDYNTAYFTKGSVTNYGNIDLRSQYDLELRNNDPDHIQVGYGSVGIISENTTDPSINKGKIITGLSDTQNMMYSVGMGAGRNFYRVDPSTREKVYDRTEGQGYVVNDGEIVVQEENGIGMLATGRGSKAINNGTIRLVGKNGVGMYIDREAIGENHGTITGDAENLKGVVAINGGYIKNYGTIKVEGTGSYGIVTDSSKFTLDANGNPIAYHTDTSSAEYRNGTTAGQANGHGGTDLYGGTETSIEEGTTGNPKTTGVGTTITRPNIVPLTSVTIDGVEQPIFNFNNDADVVGKQAENILVTSSIQTVATGATELQIPIWLRAKDEYGNPAWPRYNSPQMSEVTRIGMYVDTSGVRYTNPIDGIEKLTNLGKVNLYFGPEITEYTNSKAIRIANNRKEVAPGQYVVEENNILKPFNDALRRLPGGATINPLSSSLTWQVSANIDDNNQITELVMSKVPYHSFAFDGDKRLINFTNNLDNIYEIARPGSEEKMIFNKLNSIGNGEGHILAQAFDQMRGHIYGGIQQRTNATSNLLTDELAQLRSENNASKDSNKIKAFGRREEYKTDTAGLPDWHSNAGGFVYLHEDETVKLGDRSGWYAGVVNNYFTFKDLARSYENQAMLKTGIFKQTPLDEDGTFTFTIGGDAFFGKTNTKRRFWVVDKEFRAKSDYYTYGADINAKLEKEFRLTEGFSIVPNVGLDVQYGRFSTVREDGDMALKIKSDDYYSVKPKAGVDFRYAQPVFKKSNFTASVGLAYETELGRLNDVDNEAKIQGAWTDYYSIKGDKEDRKGNFKSDLKLGLDNGRLGFTVNTGYDTKGHNFRAGLGLRALF